MIRHNVVKKTYRVRFVTDLWPDTLATEVQAECEQQAKNAVIAEYGENITITEVTENAR